MSCTYNEPRIDAHQHIRFEPKQSCEGVCQRILVQYNA